MRVKFTLAAALAICTIVASTPAVRAFDDPEPKSAVLARELVAAMSARQIDTIAAVDPADPARIIGAMAFPGVQLLVTSAEHKSIDFLKLQMEKRRYRDVYDALQFGVQATQLFFHDMGADGFVPGEHIDLFYEGSSRTLFDGNWMAQSLSEVEYAEKRRLAEEKYVHALTTLLEAVRKLPIATGADA